MLNSPFISDFDCSASWSVNYHGVPYDDARKVDGVWWYRSAVDRTTKRFRFQDRVVPLSENPTIFMPRNGTQRMPCEERERLGYLYLAAINRHAEVSKTVPLVNTHRWRLATEGSRAECGDALYELNEHRKEHGR
jgi:hypothetical protein